MADSIANILMRLTGEDDDATDTLERFYAKLKAFGETEAEAEADVNIGDGELRLLALITQLAAFAKIDATAEANVDVDQGELIELMAILAEFEANDIGIEVDVNQAAALSQLVALKAVMETIDGQEVQVDVDTSSLQSLQAIINSFEVQDIDLTIDADSAQAQAHLLAFLVAAQAVARDVEVAVEVDNATAVAKLTELLALILGIPREVEVDVTVTQAAALAQLAVLGAAIQTVENQDVEIDVDYTSLQTLQAVLASMQNEDIDLDMDVHTQAAMAHVIAFMAAANAVARDLDVDVDVNTNLASRVLLKLASVFGQVGESAKRMGDSMKHVTVNFGLFGTKLTPVIGILLAFILVIAVSLVAALALVVTSLAGATAAVIALATAFVVSLGPAVALAIAVFQRLAKVIEAVKAQSAAKSPEAVAGAAAEAERRHDALVAVGQAVRGVTAAERGLEQATDAAKDAIVQANREETSAMQAVASAARNVEEQFVEAHKAMRQSVEDVKHAVLDLEGAELGIESTAIATQRAELELRKLQDEAGATGEEFDRLFNKFTDVAIDFDVGQLEGIIPSGGDSSGEDRQIQLAEAIIRVREAKLGEKKATLELSDAENNLSEKRATAARFAKEGIAAFGPYTDALRSQRDATVRLADARARANELEEQGIANAPSVIAAQDSLTAAQERLTEARRNSKNLASTATGGPEAEKAAKLWDELSVAEQNFGKALMATGGALKSFFGPAVEGVLNGLTGALNALGSVAGGALQSAFTNFGIIVGQVFQYLAQAFANPAMAKGLVDLINGAAQLATILGTKAFVAFFQILMAIANAAMPYLIEGAQRLSTWLQKLANSGKGNGLAKLFETLMGHLGDIWTLVKAVGGVFLAFFGATGGQAKSFVKTLTEMANKLKTFLTSESGQDKLKQFFEDMIPLAKEAIVFIGNLIITIIAVVQALAPAMTGIIAAMNFLLGIINRILIFLRPFLQIVFQLAILFLGGLPKGIATVLSKIKLLGPLVALLSTKFVGFITAVIGRLGAFASFFPGMFDKIRSGILDFLDWIGDNFGKVPGIIKDAFTSALDFLVGLQDKFLEAGKKIVTAIVDGIKSAPGAIGKGIGKLFGKAVDLLPGSEPKDKSSPLAGLADRGRAIMQNIAAGIPRGAEDLSKAMQASLVPVVATIDHQVNLPRAAAPSGAGPPTTPPGGGVHIGEVNLKGPGTEFVDPTVAAAKFLRLIENAGGVPGGR